MVDIDIIYRSTRGSEKTANCQEAIAYGLCDDGGLYVPDIVQTYSYEALKALATVPYSKLAAHVMGFLLPTFTDEELLYCVEPYNGENFSSNEIAPLVDFGDDKILELWRGPTCAFKDMALQVLPRLLTTSMKKLDDDKKSLILTATSGDTGKAALEGFANIQDTKIAVFYPVEGVSAIQQRQMTTQKGDNVDVIAIRGNFDDAQNAVKSLFADIELQTILQSQGYRLSSANSINWGRLLAQIVYYISVCARLIANDELAVGETVNIVVPTGNFGNILAAFYAKKMGAPIEKLICASNENNVLCDFINTGVYDRNRDFHKTISPSMDILISSNLERLLYILSNDSNIVSEYMSKLNTEGRYEISESLKNEIATHFYANYADDKETLATIKASFESKGYLLDTHTAVAVAVLEKYKQSGQCKGKCVIASTASPYKFSSDVAKAVGIDTATYENEFDIMRALCDKTKVDIPKNLIDLDSQDVRFNKICDLGEEKQEILNFLEI